MYEKLIAKDVIRRTGPWLVLLHGLQSCRELYSEFIRDSRFDGYSFLAIDFIGFGESKKPSNFSYDLRDQGRAVFALIDDLSISKFSLVCHSFSGTVATLMFEEHADRIDKLVSMEGNLVLADSTHSHELASKPFEEAKKFWQECRLKMREDFRNSGPQRHLWTESTPDEVIYKTAQSIIAHTESGRLLQVFETAPAAKLLILGERGSFVSRPQAENVTITTIPDAGHFMLTDNPSTTLSTIQSFLAS